MVEFIKERLSHDCKFFFSISFKEYMIRYHVFKIGLEVFKNETLLV